VKASEGSPGDFDVAILGGGPAGCATALALARMGGLRILLVEAGCYEGPRIGESIPPDTRILLEKLGIWENFLNECHEPCLGSCSSWGADSLGYNDFLFNPLGNGWHLDRMRFDAFLARKASELGVQFLANTRFQGCDDIGADSYRLRLNGADQKPFAATARFVVDATGTRSCFARCMGAGKLFLDQLICVTAFFELPTSADFSRLTMLEAVDYGWWYAARLPNRRLAVAVCSDPNIIKHKALRKREGFLRNLEQTSHISAALAACHFVDNSETISAAPSFLLNEVAGNRWLAAGDAACAYDPISSQGIHKAISNGIEAASAVTTFLHGGAGQLGEYRDLLAARFHGYLEQRNFFYGLEQRWPTSPFWTNRRARAALAA
jgi:flavin-dependent dehydrogenase